MSAARLGLAVCLIATLVTIPRLALPDSTEKAEGLLAEGRRLSESARTPDHVSTAERRIREARKIFQQLGNERGVAKSDLELGFLFVGQKITVRKAIECFNNASEGFTKAGDPIGQAEALKGLGGTLAQLGETQKAESCLEKALSLAQMSQDVQGQQLALLSMADLLKRTGSHEKAISTGLRAVQLVNDEKAPEVAVTVRAWLGEAYRDVARFSEAEEQFRAIAGLARRLGKKEQEGQALDQLGLLMQAQSRSREADQFFQSALVVARDSRARTLEANILLHQCGLFLAVGQSEKAITCCQDASRAARQGGVPAVQIRSLLKMGEVFRSARNPDRAIESWEKAVALSSDIQDPALEAQALQYLGSIAVDQGRLDKASQYFQRALRVNISLEDHRKEAENLATLASIARRNQNLPEAIQYYRRSLEAARAGHDEGQASHALMGLGIVETEFRSYKEAEESLNAALTIRKRLGKLAGQAQVLVNLGNLYFQSNQYQKAEDSMNMALQLYELAEKQQAELNGKVLAESRDFVDRGYADALTGEAIRLRRGSVSQPNLEKAKDYLHKAVKIYTRLGHFSEAAHAYESLGRVYSQLGQPKQAVESWDHALSMAREVRDERWEASILTDMLTTLPQADQLSKAEQAAQRCLDLCRKLGDLRCEARLRHSFGIVLDVSGRPAEALESFEGARRIFEKLNLRFNEALSLQSKGLVFSSWGRYPEAVSSYEKSLQLIRQTHRLASVEATVLRNLGITYGHLGEIEKAMECLKESMQLSTKTEHAQAERLAAMDMARVLRENGRLKEALEEYQSYVERQQRLNRSTEPDNPFLAELYLDCYDIHKAEAVLEKSKNPKPLSRLYFMKEDYEQALKYYQMLMHRAESTNDTEGLFLSHTALGAVLERQGERSAAEQHFRTAVKLTEDLRSSLPKAERQRFFDVQVGGFFRTAPYKGLARILVAEERPAEALKWSEYTKARNFAETLLSGFAPSTLGAPPEVVEEGESLSDQLAALKKHRTEISPKLGKETLLAINQLIEDVTQKFSDYKIRIKRGYPRYAATKYPEPVELCDSALKDDVRVLEFDVTETGVLIYLTKGRREVKSWFRPINRPELEKLVRKFMKPVVMDPNTPSEEKLCSFDFLTGKKLADLLLADALEELPRNSPIIIVPDGILGLLPFEMLVLNSNGRIIRGEKFCEVSGAEFFGKRYAISYAQSIYAIAMSRTFRDRSAPAGRLLLIADPVISDRDHRCGSAQRLCRRSEQHADTTLKKGSLSAWKGNAYRSSLVMMSQSAGGELSHTANMKTTLNQLYQVDALEGFRATKANLMVEMEEQLPLYETVVFATHGDLTQRSVWFREPVLVLTLMPPGTDGLLTMHDVMGMKFNADVVALVACQSGVGDLVRGDGTMNMGRAFQYAGAKSVLMSLWYVDQKASVKLTEHFLTLLKDAKKKRSKQQALREARQALREEGFNHPFFWCSFILMGDVE